MDGAHTSGRSLPRRDNTDALTSHGDTTFGFRVCDTAEEARDEGACGRGIVWGRERSLNLEGRGAGAGHGRRMALERFLVLGCP